MEDYKNDYSFVSWFNLQYPNGYGFNSEDKMLTCYRTYKKVKCELRTAITKRLAQLLIADIPETDTEASSQRLAVVNELCKLINELR
jgi:hypothetical protein